jgi:glycosyltransferase involved in cell wall biosynthesis
MKILQLIQKPQLRGAEIFACQLADELQSRNIEVVVVSLFKGDAVLPFKGRLINLDLSPKKRLLDINGWRQLAALIKREKPDIIQANAGDTLKYAVFSKLLFKWKGFLIFRNASTVSLYIKNKLQQWWMYKLYSHVDYVISVSDNTKNDLVRLFPFLKNKISIAPVGVALEDSAPQKRSDQIILLHIGGFSFEKNHLGLIRIFESFKKQHDNSILWLVGDGPLRKSTEEFVASKNLQDAVRFWGYRPDPASFLKSCDVFLLPSIIEGLPSVILEAFYCKVPVVAYQVGGIPELIKPGESGWLIEKGNEKEFSNAIAAATAKSASALQMVENAYELVIRNYTLKSVVDRFLIIYNKLISRENN